MHHKIFIGVDPGTTGGIAIIGSDGRAIGYKMPETKEEVLEMLDTDYLWRPWQKTNSVEITRVLEVVHSSPQQGVATSFKFGRMFGWVEMALARYDPIEVSPQKWQAALNCRSGGDKNIPYAKAKKLFPDAKGLIQQTADAFLIAYYGYLKQGTTFA